MRTKLVTLIIAITVLAAMMIALERISTGREFSRVKGWYPRAALLNIGQAIAAFIGAYTWDIWLQDLALYDLSDEPRYLRCIIGYLVVTFAYYWWHRARHSSHILWNLFHQIHHSPQRLEIITSFYKHPLEIIANGFLTSLLLYVLLGLDPTTVTIVVAMTAIAELFYHWNINTPYWLGFFIQRPESHCVHHRRHRHTANFSDLPLWDMIFGTFHNPKIVDFSCGFAEDRELKLKSMLAFKNVNKPKKTKHSCNQ